MQRITESRTRWLFFVLTAALILACNLVTRATPESEKPAATPTQEPAAAKLTPVVILTIVQPVSALAESNIAQVWANDGGDKIIRNELRAFENPSSVLNSIWNGGEILLFGAHNEVVSFNMVLEAPDADATDVDVTLMELNGPDGAVISTRTAGGEDLFDYVGRHIELFYVRYLEIKGLSTDLFYGGYDYDERHVPFRCRRPHDEEGEGSGRWEDRPCHNKLYPDIAVPLELETPFTIEEGTNQSIWGDIYIPKDIPQGEYRGSISISEEGVITRQIPIRLQIRDFTLPDLPSARTMVAYSFENVNNRYLGTEEVAPDSTDYDQSLLIADRHFQLAHRHKISLIDDYTPIERMDEAWEDRLDGNLFTPTRGYDGIGVGVGNNVYPVGTYQSWPWTEGDEEDMWANTDAWVRYFDELSLTTATDYFLYLIDEPEIGKETRQAEEWAEWIEGNPGPGREMMSFVTIDIPTAVDETPSVDISASGAQFGLPEEWEGPAQKYQIDTDRRLYFYNGNRPATGSFAIEDDGVALRMLPWVQYKKGIDRWFYWESTYYNNYQGDTGETNVFQRAQTYGSFDEVDEVLGETGWNYLNGDGVLIYPGTDLLFNEESYGVAGPIASLRMKHWRRGIQDVDYLVLAAQINPDRTAEIVQAMVPKVLWEVGVTDPEDPSYVFTDISWPTDPDLWEAARSELADIIEGTAR